MKTIKILVALCLFSAVLFTSCDTTYNEGDRIEGTTNAHVDSVSYAIGVFFANSVGPANFGEMNYCKIMEGLKDGLNKDSLKINENEIMPFLQGHLRVRTEKLAEAELKEGTDFLAKNKEKEGVVEKESGLQYLIVSEGSGISPVAADTVEVKYRGTLIDGTEFDASPVDETVKFPLNRVIPGWTEGIQYVKEGGEIKLFIPSGLAYGAQGAGAKIPGNATLIFEVELVKVFPAAKK